ncbi:uncharacterized protein [Littorina saxatilis]|uniref:uncharacterized protein n=1 Tax=Littorina saxatilis TaxID=31220 RepID=UPI0038B4328B
MPIVTSQPRSRPTSTTSDTMIDGENATLSTRGSPSVSYQGSVGVNSPVRRPPQSPSERDFNSSSSAASPPRSTIPSVSSTPARAWNGVVNTAYIPTSDEPHSPPGPRSPLSLKSRKGSSASSEFFLAPSVSLADSMASELEKAFRSMHQDISLGGASSPSGQTPSLHSLNTAHLQQQDLEGVPMGSLRRSRSATGRSSFVEAEPLQTVEKADEPKTWEGAGTDRKGVEPVRKGAEPEPDGAWHQKLFRSRSDNSGGIRTKDVGSGGTYMSLLDIEKQQQEEQPTGAPSSSPSALAGSVHTESPKHTVTCVDGGAGYRPSDNSRLSDDAPVLTDTVKKHAADSGDDCSDKVGGRHVDSIVSSPSPVSDVTNVNGVIVTSPRPPYCTVIPIRSVPRDRSDSVRSGDSGSGSILQGSKPQPSSSAITNSSPVSHSTSVSVTPRGMTSPASSTSPLTPGGLSGMNSSKGMLGY